MFETDSKRDVTADVRAGKMKPLDTMLNQKTDMTDKLGDGHPSGWISDYRPQQNEAESFLLGLD